MARGWSKRRNKPRDFGHLWARNRSSRTVSFLFRQPLFPSPKRPPRLLHVRARGPPRPHGPWSPSPGLSSSPPTAPQHSQCKLELRQTLPLFLLAMIVSTWPKICVLVHFWPFFFLVFNSASKFLVFLFERVKHDLRTAPCLCWAL